jgi:hypothetical protein
MRYTGESCAATEHTQDEDDVQCEGDPAFEPVVFIRASDEEDATEDDANVWFEGAVGLDEFVFIESLAAGRSRLRSRTFVHIFDLSGNLLQFVEFHTSCSEPLNFGDQFGSLLLVDYAHEGDCIPPSDTIRLNRDALWPPNGKMVDIVATIPIAEDPEINFVLSGITSSEQGGGMGREILSQDIRGADLGTPDLEFELRSERPGDAGRIYTVVYTISDSLGSFAVEREIRVPNTVEGSALPSAGFSETGSSLDPESDLFALVIPSLPEESGSPGGGGFDATQLLEVDVAVGNTAGVLKTSRRSVADVTGDGLEDVAFFFPVGEAVDLAARSDNADGPLGLYYRIADGADYLVPSIFELGPPVALESNDGAAIRGRPAVPSDLPRATALSNVYPNPFRPSTTISFALAQEEHVRLEVYNAQGALVRTVLDGPRPAGRYDVVWNARNDSGNRLGSGVYFVRLTAGTVQEMRKIVMLR